MKILLVNKFWYLRGGAERVVFLTKGLLEKAGHTVEIFGMRHPQNLIENDFFTDYLNYNSKNPFVRLKCGLKAVYNFNAQKKFQKLIEEFKPDIAHFHNIYHQLSFSLIPAVKKMRVPSVMTLHDYKLISPNYNLFHHGRIDERCVGEKYYKCIFSDCMEGLGRDLIATAEAYAMRKMKIAAMIDLCISPSKFLKEKFVSAGFAEEKIQVVPNPLPEPSFVLSKKEGAYAAYFGRLSEEKGVRVLLDVADSLAEIHFKIAGAGPLENELRSRAKQRKLVNVEFLGYKDKEAVDEIIDNARIVVVPSLWFENCPLSILEAMAKGKIVIASRIGGIPELLPDDLLVMPGDVKALAEKIKLWHNKPFSEIMKKGAELFESARLKSDPKSHVEKLLEIYERARA